MMRRDVQLLVPLVIFGLSFLAVVLGLFLLIDLKWDAALEDVGLVEPTKSSFSIPLPISLPGKISKPEPTLVPTSGPTVTEVPLERKTHDPKTRTGVEDIDRIIDLVLGVDDNDIRDALHFTLTRCTHTDGLGGLPKCRGGEYEGTQIEVLPIIGSEGHFFRKDEIDDWRGIGVVGLYAAYEVSEGAFYDENYPAGKYAVMFMESDHQFLVLQIADGGVVRIDYVFGTDPETKIAREAQKVILAPLPLEGIPSTGLGLTVPGWHIEPAPSQEPSSEGSKTTSPRESSEDILAHDRSTRTGVAEIDRIIDLVLGGHVVALKDRLVFISARCTNPQGLGGLPKCREDEAEGDQVEIFPILGPEGGHFRKDQIENWQGIDGAGLYAAYEVSEEAFSDEYFPAGQYAVMFIDAKDQFIVLQIDNGGIVRIDFVLGTPPEEKLDREAQRIILPPLSSQDTPAEFSNLVLTRNPYQRKPQFVFPNKTPVIYAIWDYANMREGMTIRREWHRDGELWLERVEPWDFEKYGASGTITDVSIYDFDDGIDPGTYYLRLYVDELELGGSQNFYVLERGYAIEPRPSSDGSLIATVEAPGTLLIQEGGGRKRQLLTVGEIADLEWFPDGKNILFVSVDHSLQMSPNTMLLGFEIWIVNIDSGVRRMIASPTESIREASPSPNGGYIAGISGSRWGDACLYDAFLVVLKLDRNLKRTETYHLEDFTGVLENPNRDAWYIHPDNIRWINARQFTAELRHHCMEWFDSGVYLFDMDSMHARKIGEVENGSVYSY